MSDLIGHSLGRYHILEQLGEGGMAVVYKAYDTRLEREMAVKIIRTDALPPNALKRTLKRFEREAKSLARLTHPNIVKVIDYGEHDGSPYLVMPLLPGGTLKAMLRGKQIPWQEAIQTLLPIASALGYAHKHDIIHRDVKPANILIAENGQPMLADFGVAKLLDIEETLELTGTGVGIGTPEYMAPEQATNKHVDARADIYALGIVLFEMVTGRKPFIADTPMAVLIMHSRDPLPRPKSFAPNLPQPVENVLIKALAKDPQNRYQSMEEFAQALEGLPGGKTVHAPQAGEGKQRAEFKFPRRAAIIVGLAVIGLGMCAVFSKLLFALPAQLFAVSTPSATATSVFISTPGGAPLWAATLPPTSAPTSGKQIKLIYMQDDKPAADQVIWLSYYAENSGTWVAKNSTTDQDGMAIFDIPEGKTGESFTFTFAYSETEVNNFASQISEGKKPGMRIPPDFSQKSLTLKIYGLDATVEEGAVQMWQPQAALVPAESPTPMQLEVTHSPNPAKFKAGGASGSAYTCAYKTSVKAVGTGVRIEGFGMYFWENNQWVHSTSNNGQPWSPENFADWYSCPGAYIKPGQVCSDPNNWNSASAPSLTKGKWYYIGVDDNGNKVQGEAVIECQP